MHGTVRIACTAAIVLGFVAAFASAEAPKPSLYPVSWELKFEHATPKRVVVSVPNAAAPQAYWYMTFSATNNTGKERMFLPVFEMLAEDGKVIRSDKLISQSVIDVIRKHEGNKFIEGGIQVSGEIRLGDDQTKYGVAVWPEPTLEMGRFSIFVGGLSGEYQTIKADGKDTILRKSLRLNFWISGDDVYAGEDKVNVDKAETWVMR
jgi:hypothetical protein